MPLPSRLKTLTPGNGNGEGKGEEASAMRAAFSHSLTSGSARPLVYRLFDFHFILWSFSLRHDASPLTSSPRLASVMLAIPSWDHSHFKALP